MKQEDKLFDVFQDVERLYYNTIAKLAKHNIKCYQILFKGLYRAVINIIDDSKLDRETKTIKIMDIRLTMKKEIKHIESIHPELKIIEENKNDK